MTPEDRADQAAALSRVVVSHLMTPTPIGARDEWMTAPGPEGSARRGTVAAYLGADTEPGTASLLEALHLAGFDVVVPVCEAGFALSWSAWWPGVPLARSVRAPVDEPLGPRRSFGELDGVRVVLVPALGIDLAGARIGQGGGYYDRFLAQFPPACRGGTPAMAVVYRSEVLPAGSIPAGTLDQSLTGAYTADGPLLFGPPRSPV